MRRLEDGDRLIASEATAALKDAPESTLVLEGTAVTEQSATEIDVAAGEILVDRDVVDVSQTVEELDLPEAAGGDETHYRYVTVSRDAQGAVVLTNGAVGTIDSEGEISAPVPAQAHPEGNVYLATVLVDEDRILDIYDGRALLESRVEDFRTQGDAGQFPVATNDGILEMDVVDVETLTSQGGSGTVPVSQGDGTVQMDSGENSGIDADTVRGTLGVPSDGIVGFDSETGNIPSGWLFADGNNGTPDLRDRFLTGAGDSYTLGETGGEATVTLTESELASHDHTYQHSNDDGTGSMPEGINSDLSEQNFRSTKETGGDSAHENRPPFYAVNWIVKA